MIEKYAFYNAGLNEATFENTTGWTFDDNGVITDMSFRIYCGYAKEYGTYNFNFLKTNITASYLIGEYAQNWYCLSWGGHTHSNESSLYKYDWIHE